MSFGEEALALGAAVVTGAAKESAALLGEPVQVNIVVLDDECTQTLRVGQGNAKAYGRAG